MIPKAEILQYANNYELLPTTIHKDYVLGWLLCEISIHKELSKWVFKGGTCLKKCYFETYRFSEDLDFTIPKELEINIDYIQKNLEEITTEIESNSGITFPRKDWKIEEYENKRGNTSYKVKISFDGPLKQPVKSLQRVKFDLTQDELIADDPVKRIVYNNYSDKVEPAPQIRCYSINEILAEKTRALAERFGRARDVYDVVNISRNFRSEIDSDQAVKIAQAKFDYKDLDKPTVHNIIEAIDTDSLKVNWEAQLRHQINELPPVDSYISDLEDAIAWWLDPTNARPELEPMPEAIGLPVERKMFPDITASAGPSAIDKIRRAAGSRFLVLVEYKGIERLVEPYSLRYTSTGNEILHVWEVKKNGEKSESHKSFITDKLTFISTSNHTFNPKWLVEL